MDITLHSLVYARSACIALVMDATHAYTRTRTR